MIARTLAPIILEELKHSNKIIILYGSRQVGKTTMIDHLMQQLNYKVLKVNADTTEDSSVLSSRSVDALERFIGDADLLYIDEAQRITDIGINLKIIHDQLPSKKVIATGSSSLDLANRISEPLTGRTWTYTLYPISFREWLHYRQLDAGFTAEKLEALLLYGSYPEVLTIKGERRKVQYLNELKRAYLYKDVLALGNVKYPEKLNQLAQLLAYQIGQFVSTQELANSLKISRDAVNRYIDLLEKGFVLFRLRGFNRNLRKEITKMHKIYFYDLGVRNAVINDFSPIHLRKDKGSIWENYLISERFKYLQYNQIYASSYFWSTHTGAEVDYVEEKGGQLTGFEFKWNPKKYRDSYAPWSKAYPEAAFECITPEQVQQFI
ncbi:MAG: AAA family ATPase [Bacteroidetes bacterium]|jgi:predicted AAA+ superfamily ATPase|nr:AAA family ATPase [Bacteroidota bacterium]